MEISYNPRRKSQWTSLQSISRQVLTKRTSRRIECGAGTISAHEIKHSQVPEHISFAKINGPPAAFTPLPLAFRGEISGPHS